MTKNIELAINESADGILNLFNVYLLCSGFAKPKQENAEHLKNVIINLIKGQINFVFEEILLQDENLDPDIQKIIQDSQYMLENEDDGTFAEFGKQCLNAIPKIVEIFEQNRRLIKLNQKA